MLEVSTYTLIFLVMLVALILGLVLIPLCMALARRIGAVDYPRLQYAKNGAIPRLGGLAIYGSAVVVLSGSLVFLPLAVELLAPLKHQLAGFFLGGTAVLLLGLADDIRGLRARWKLLGQILVALFIYWWGLRVEVITNLLDPGNPIQLGALAIPLNVLWVVLAMNAMNIIDGLDGLAGGVFLLALTLLFATGLMGGNLAIALVTAALMGATAAFLRFNFFSGSIYLGDSGSLLTGYCLAAFVPLFVPKAAGMAAALIPFAVLSVPIAEVVVTTIRRFWRGRPVAKADDGHAHHRMLRGGMGQRKASLFIQGLSLACGILALSMTYVFNRPLAALMGVLWLAMLGLFVKVGYFPRNKNKREKESCEPSGTHYRAPIFLDAERVIQKRLWSLAQANSEQDIRDSLLEIGRTLRLVGLGLEFIDQNGREFSLPAISRAGQEEGFKEISVTLNMTTPGGLKGQLVAVMDSDQSHSIWPGLLTWLNHLKQSLAQPLDRNFPSLAASQEQTPSPPSEQAV